MIRIDPSGLKETRWHEFALRFLIGGGITVMAGLIAKSFGPVIGGLFLAFPAIFPASATLVAKHEEEKKAKAGLHGHARALEAAGLTAVGAALGCTGLAAFAVINWAMLARYPALVTFVIAIAVWFAGAYLAWLGWKRSHKLRPMVRR